MRCTVHKAPLYAVFSVPCYNVPFMSKYFPQHLILYHPKPVFPPSMWEAKFYTHIEERAKLYFSYNLLGLRKSTLILPRALVHICITDRTEDTQK